MKIIPKILKSVVASAIFLVAVPHSLLGQDTNGSGPKRSNVDDKLLNDLIESLNDSGPTRAGARYPIVEELGNIGDIRALPALRACIGRTYRYYVLSYRKEDAPLYTVRERDAHLDEAAARAIEKIRGRVDLSRMYQQLETGPQRGDRDTRRVITSALKVLDYDNFVQWDRMKMARQAPGIVARLDSLLGGSLMPSYVRVVRHPASTLAVILLMLPLLYWALARPSFVRLPCWVVEGIHELWTDTPCFLGAGIIFAIVCTVSSTELVFPWDANTGVGAFALGGVGYVLAYVVAALGTEAVESRYLRVVLRRIDTAVVANDVRTLEKLVVNRSAFVRDRALEAVTKLRNAETGGRKIDHS